ncbi:MAG: YihY/virulence factor BrkB family protein [Bdellovibrionia bacterium]
MPYGLPLKTFTKRFSTDLKNEIKNDNVSNGAAALAYYWMLAIFPAMIALLSLLPYLPIPNLQQSVMDLLGQMLPGDASKMFTGTVQEVVSQRKGGLLSVGLLLTVWAASNGMYAIMQQLNITYDVKEGRSFFKARATAILLTFLVGALIVAGLSLVVFGGVIQNTIGSMIGQGSILTTVFAVLRWVIIAAALTLAFAVTYYLGPDVEQKFKFISPGSLAGVGALIVASLGFRLYVDHFGKYNATYGSIGAVIILMLWLNIAGFVILLGSEVNALVEHYNPAGKNKGEKKEGPSAPEAPPQAA